MSIYVHKRTNVDVYAILKKFTGNKLEFLTDHTLRTSIVQRCYSQLTYQTDGLGHQLLLHNAVPALLVDSTVRLHHYSYFKVLHYFL